MNSIYKFCTRTAKFTLAKTGPTASIIFGSANGKVIERDFPPSQRKDFTIRREILWESESATVSEVTAKELEFIVLYGSNDPAIGYNQWPKFKGPV